jgi:hypothetical protein
MTALRQLHEIMTRRQSILLSDGRTGKIMRVDTEFPSNTTTVSVWTETAKGPGIAKVGLDRVVGPAPATHTATGARKPVRSA